MSKVSKDFKNDVDNEIAEAGYIFKKVMSKVVIAIIILGIIAGIFGFCGKYFKTNADRIIFKQSVTYNEGVLDDLAKYKLQMIQAETETEKKAIANLVVDRFANYDESKIESYDLKKFLADCRNLNVEGY